MYILMRDVLFERCPLIKLFQFYSDKRANDGIQASPQTMNIVATGSHARSTSYSVSYCTRKTNNLPIESKGKKKKEPKI